MSILSDTSSEVFINVYDLSPQNAYMYWCGLGIYHTGVQVYGVEYAYGGHDCDFSGVFATKPKDCPGHAVYRESVSMGRTILAPGEVQSMVARMGSLFKGNRYHLLQRNCNHFTNEVCIQLVGKPAPGWVNRLADMAISLHCLLPQTWVPPLQSSKGKTKGRRHSETQSLVRSSSSNATSSFVEPPRMDSAAFAAASAAAGASGNRI